MPLWTDIDTRFSGETYYRIYDLYNKPETKRELNSLDNFFIKFGEKKFNPVWALKITWNKVVPYNAVENEVSNIFTPVHSKKKLKVVYMQRGEELSLSVGGERAFYF